MRVKQVRIGESSATVAIDFESDEIMEVTRAIGTLLQTISSPAVEVPAVRWEADVNKPASIIDERQQVLDGLDEAGGAQLEGCPDCVRLGDDRYQCRRANCSFSTKNAAATLVD